MPKSRPIRPSPRPGSCATTRRWRSRYPNATRCLSERLGHVGADAVIRPPFFCDFGYNIRLGDGVFLNFNCVILDVVEVTIGDRTQIGPAVQIYAADHPARRRNPAPAASNSAARCGSAAMSGSAAAPSSCPASTIGDGAVIGAGSVVTRDVGAGETVAGNPARPRSQDRQSKTDATYSAGFAIPAPGCYGKPMFARRTITALAARLPPELRLGARPGSLIHPASESRFSAP